MRKIEFELAIDQNLNEWNIVFIHIYSYAYLGGIFYPINIKKDIVLGCLMILKGGYVSRWPQIYATMHGFYFMWVSPKFIWVY